ncbi:spore germination protein [Evansella halocellulosilytica]|uniref:spore germination protein n=1 Tax=Evansella halocellulosilytica TaxID=2011013 RepID=UPI000BB92124|nr:spore germination protein [Evansella halocellulosilytica]
MDNFVEDIKNKFQNNDDFFYQIDYILDVPVMFFGFKTLIDLDKTKVTIQKCVDRAVASEIPFEKLLALLGKVKEGSIEEATASIVEGKMIIHVGDDKFVIVEPIFKSLNRAVEQPSSENVLQGSLSSFIEDLDTNIGILRRGFSSERLCVQSYNVGHEKKKKLSLLYDEDRVDMSLVKKISQQVESNNQMDVTNIQQLSKMLNFTPWDSVSKFQTTELTLEAVSFLLKGRVVLLIDRIPYALILPSLLWDMFTVDNDRNFTIPLMLLIRSVRVIGVLATLIIPGLYVALVAVNPEVLRMEMALSIAQSRQGVPYPALVEIIIMLVILELILEASVRLPKSVGPTISMVGGIILGQAIVDAQLVSNLLIIILAATTIANFAIVGVQNALAIRLFKYVIVVLASIYGVLGILVGMLFVCAYLASLTSFGVSYLHLNSSKG